LRLGPVINYPVSVDGRHLNTAWGGESRLPHSAVNRRQVIRNRFRRGGFFDS
jgi:hypothetical protein